MRILKLSVLMFLISGSLLQAKAAGGSGFGGHFGMGLPFLSQYGLNYQFSDKFGISASQNVFSVEVDSVKVELSLPEIMFNYHPFGGAYFIGLGVGQQSFEVSTGTTGVDRVAIEVEAMNTILKTGWMWGLADQGFWFGIDFAMMSPSNAESTITAPGVPTTDQAYIDAKEAADQYGESSYSNLTFARFGYIF